jgi:hypothetical protein
MGLLAERDSISGPWEWLSKQSHLHYFERQKVVEKVVYSH